MMMKMLLGNTEHSMARMQRENENYSRREESVMQMKMELFDHMEQLKDRSADPRIEDRSGERLKQFEPKR